MDLRGNDDTYRPVASWYGVCARTAGTLPLARDNDCGDCRYLIDPVIRTYDSMVNSYGATRFLADGTIIASDGSQGVWKLFDPDNHIYTVVIGPYKASLQYRAGYGLVKPSEPNLISFQEVRRRN